MRNFVGASRSGIFIAAALLIATGIAVRIRPNGTIGPVPGPSISGFWPTLAVISALLVAIIATTAGAISVVRRPRAGGNLPEAPSGDWRWMHIRLSYLALALVAVVASLIVLALAPHELVPVETEPPSPPAAEQPSKPPPPQNGTPTIHDNAVTAGAGAAIGLVVVATIALVILGATWRATIRRRMVGVSREATGPAPAPEPLVRATELALQEVVEPGRAPGEAIIACFATMERALANTEFAPRASDTAKEVIDRAVEHALMPLGPAGTLRDLFTEARFSAHRMTPAQRDSAASALREILGGWRS